MFIVEQLEYIISTVWYILGMPREESVLVGIYLFYLCMYLCIY
nr:MAG TPA: hypothetical protein [Caudoviricetes sp.]